MRKQPLRQWWLQLPLREDRASLVSFGENHGLAPVVGSIGFPPLGKGDNGHLYVFVCRAGRQKLNRPA
jgi:hypothetical protein